jgi:hypothetical protein
MGDFNFDAERDFDYPSDRVEVEDGVKLTENQRHFTLAIPEFQDVWALLHPDDKGSLSLSFSFFLPCFLQITNMLFTDVFCMFPVKGTLLTAHRTRTFGLMRRIPLEVRLSPSGALIALSTSKGNQQEMSGKKKK